MSAFVKLKYIEVLTNLPSFKEGRYSDALRESFHKVDELLEDEQYLPLLKQLRAVPNPSDTRGTPNRSGPASSPKPLPTSEGGSIIRPLTAPDRTASPESDDGEDLNSPLPHNKGGLDSMAIIQQLLESAKQYSRAKNRNDKEAIAEATLSLTGNLRNLHAVRAAANSSSTPDAEATESAAVGTTPSAFAEDNSRNQSEGAFDSSTEDDNDADVENNLERDSEDSVDHEFARHMDRDMSDSPTLSETETSTISVDSSSPTASISDSSASGSEGEDDLSIVRNVAPTKPVVVLDSSATSTAFGSPANKPSPPKSPSKVNNNPFKGETYQSVFSERVNEEVVTSNAVEDEADAPSEPDTESHPIFDTDAKDEIIPKPPTLQLAAATTSSSSSANATEEDDDTGSSDDSSDEELSPPKVANRLVPTNPTDNSPTTTERPPAPANFTTYTTSGKTHICKLKDHR